MRESIREFVAICAEVLPVTEPIYEFGSYQVEGQIGFADLRPLFPNMRYVGTDYRAGPGVDVVLDLHEIDLPAETVGTAIAVDTLEHVEYPHRAVEELYRVLGPRGILILSSVMNFPIHDYPYDYWRFSPEAFRSLLRLFPFSHVDFVGEEDFPQTVVGIGAKRAIRAGAFRKFKERVEAWKDAWRDDKEWPVPTSLPPRTPEWKMALKQHAPPKLLSAYRRIRGVTEKSR